jgi:uncharacterized membrane protein
MEILIIFGVVLVAIVLYRLSTLSGRVNNLEWKLRDFESLQRSIASLQSLVNQLSEPKLDRSKSAGAAKSASREPDQKKQPASSSSDPVAAHAAVPSPDVRQEQKPSRTREEWEAFVGGKLLNRIAALALILGVGFFLKYAFDNNWISETVRVLIGVGAGLVCLVGAFRTHSKGFAIFAQGLVGAGSAILYLSVYASFNFYHLVPQVSAFVLMAIVTTAVLAQALYYDALAITVLGWAGGFLTPIMLNTGVSNEAGLFTYVSLLALGLVAIEVKKSAWSIVEPLTFVGVWTLYWAWHVDDYSPDKLLLTAFFVIVFWKLFFLLDFFRAAPLTGLRRGIAHTVGSANAVMLFCTSYVLLSANYKASQGLVTLFIAVLYFGAIRFVKMRREVEPETTVRHVFTSIVLLVIATALHFESYRVPLWWSFEAAALVWCGVRWKVSYVRNSAVALLVLVFLRLLSIDTLRSFVPNESFSLFMNWRALTLTCFVVAMALSAWMLHALSEEDRLIASLLTVAATTVFGAMLSLESNDFFRQRMQIVSTPDFIRLEYARALAISALWTAYTLPLLWLGIKNRFGPLIGSGVAWMSAGLVFGITGGVAFEPIAEFAAVANIRTVQMLFLFVCTILAARWIRTGRAAWEPFARILPVVQVAAVAVLFMMLTGEIRDFYRQRIEALRIGYGDTDEVLRLQNLQQLLLSIGWLLYSFLLMGVGLWRRVRGIRLIAIVVFGFTILKIFLFDLSFLETLYRIFLFIGLGVILFAVSYSYQRWREIILKPDVD